MFARLGRILLSVCLMAVIFVAAAATAKASPLPRASYASVGEPTSVPYGWVDFCNREHAECVGPVLPALDINLTNATLAKLDHINRMVNQAIQPVTNLEHWGTMLDHWDYPLDGKGDCEDYALMKRKILIDRGFPRQALLITVVRDEQNEGHAILTVKTNSGEYILDNLNDDVKPVSRVPYRLVKRQSQEDPNVWVALGPVAPTVVASR